MTSDQNKEAIKSHALCEILPNYLENYLYFSSSIADAF